MANGQTPILPAELEAWDLLVRALRVLKFAKGEERSEKARRFAITVTELEKLMAYYNISVMQERDFIKEADEMQSVQG